MGSSFAARRRFPATSANPPKVLKKGYLNAHPGR
jgi:hypothetical protein